MAPTQDPPTDPQGQVWSADLAIRPDQSWWTDGQIVALKGTLGLQSASAAELAVFFHYCNRTQLDPFTRQIHYIERRKKDKETDRWISYWVAQIGIDGFRVIRDRVARRDKVTVEYEDTLFYNADGDASDVWLLKTPPTACKVVILKDGLRFSGVARFDAYAQTYKPRATKDNPDPEPALVEMWARSGDGQLEKCAEAKALRRAFPNDLGGLYVEEEMAAAEDDAPVHHSGHTPRTRQRPRLRPEEPDGHASSQPDGYSEPRPPRNRAEALEQLHGLFNRAGFTEEDRALRLFLIGLLAVPENTEPLEVTTTTALGEADALEACRTFKLVMRTAHREDKPLRETLENIARSAGFPFAGPDEEPS